jgi:hypothetical protein|eukprot:m.209624 g.209624  ORF g.209624 m.209624 type:complete len:111 (-) comp25469_c0_seq7:242-574(-)
MLVERDREDWGVLSSEAATTLLEQLFMRAGAQLGVSTQPTKPSSPWKPRLAGKDGARIIIRYGRTDHWKLRGDPVITTTSFRLKTTQTSWAVAEPERLALKTLHQEVCVS